MENTTENTTKNTQPDTIESMGRILDDPEYFISALHDSELETLTAMARDSVA